MRHKTRAAITTLATLALAAATTPAHADSRGCYTGNYYGSVSVYRAGDGVDVHWHIGNAPGNEYLYVQMAGGPVWQLNTSSGTGLGVTTHSGWDNATINYMTAATTYTTRCAA